MLLSTSWSLEPDYDTTVNIYRSFQEFAAMRFSGAKWGPGISVFWGKSTICADDSPESISPLNIVE
jgi:hypothetical protein